jgi:hypothetical protein
LKQQIRLFTVLPNSNICIAPYCAPLLYLFLLWSFRRSRLSTRLKATDVFRSSLSLPDGINVYKIAIQTRPSR